MLGSILPKRKHALLQELRPGMFNCRARYDDYITLIYFAYITLYLYVLPAIILLVLYGFVIRTLRQGMRSEKEAMNCASNGQLGESKPSLSQKQ